MILMLKMISQNFIKILKTKLKKNYYEGGLLLVNHDIFLKNWSIYKRLFKPNSSIFDINNKLNTKETYLTL